MKPTLRQLQYLVAISEAGTFSGAARLTNVSQPSLSNQISDMEGVLGIKLIERGRGGAPLTPVCDELVARARIILRDMESFKTLAREAGESFAGKIRLGTLPSIGPYLLPLALRRLHRKYPELRVFVREERTLDLQEDLRTGKLDLIISTPEDHLDMRGIPLFEENLYVAVAPDDPLASEGEGGPIDVGSLQGRQLLSLGHGHKLAVIVKRLADVSQATVSTEYEGTSLDAIRQMAAMGGMVAVLPSLYAYSEAREDPGIVVRRLVHPLARRDISLLWRPTSPLSTKFEAIGAALKTASDDLLKR